MKRCGSLILVMVLSLVGEGSESAPPTTADRAASARGSSPAKGDDLTDFITPSACDVRCGYSINMGRYRRAQPGGTAINGDFREHGSWLSFIKALSGPSRAMSGHAEWRVELGVLASEAQVSNPNGSKARLRSAMIDVGCGPSWAISANADQRLEIEITPYAGAGRAAYRNRFDVRSGAYVGSDSAAATGPSLEYGLKANLMWCWGDGWGAAIHAGIVQKQTRLRGNTSTDWSNGASCSAPYASSDSLTGIRCGLFLARRF